jgi:hypothetical protein
MPDAAPLACPSPTPALQRLHSSALRAVRSRTRRHVAPAPAHAAAPPRPSHSRARHQPRLQRPPRATARSGLLASTWFSHLPHSRAFLCAASRHAAASASPEPSCTGSPPRSAALHTQLGSARACTLGSRSRQHRPLGSCVPPASTALLPAPPARVPRLNPAVPSCTSLHLLPHAPAHCCLLWPLEPAPSEHLRRARRLAVLLRRPCAWAARPRAPPA